MNAAARRLFVDGLLGTSRANQTVHVCRSEYGGSPLGPRHVVVVIPEGGELSPYYECGDRSLALLRAGMTPEDLELEPFEDDELEDDSRGIPDPDGLRNWYHGRVL